MTLFLIPVFFGAIMVGGFGFLSPSKSFDYAFYLTISGVCVSFLTACLFKFVMSTQGKSQQPKPNSAHDYRSRSRSAYNDIYRPPLDHDRYRSPPDHDIYRSPPDHDRYRSPPDHDRYRSPPDHDISRPPTDHDMYRPPTDHDISRPPTGHDRYRPPPDHDISRPPTDHDRYRSPTDHDIFHLPTVHYDNSGVAFSPYASRY